MERRSTPPHLSRRSFIGAGGAAALGLVVVACSNDEEPAGEGTGGSGDSPTESSAADPSTTTTSGGAADAASTGTPSTTVFTAADFAALGACLLTPEQTEGPYPTANPLERRDLRESLPGHPLRLGLQVVDEACVPVPGAVVEIWHCDTDGDYSEYADGGTDDDAGPGTTFLRGSQTANDEGIVEFVTNYPGWYRGRAVHIHTKVHLDDTTVLTSQIYFADDTNDEVFAEAPYSAHGSPDTTNAEDSIAGDPEAEGTQAHTAADAALAGTRALLVLGVDPDAESSSGSGSGSGGGAGGGPGGPSAGGGPGGSPRGGSQ